MGMMGEGLEENFFAYLLPKVQTWEKANVFVNIKCSLQANQVPFRQLNIYCNYTLLATRNASFRAVCCTLNSSGCGGIRILAEAVYEYIYQGRYTEDHAVICDDDLPCQIKTVVLKVWQYIQTLYICLCIL